MLAPYERQFCGGELCRHSRQSLESTLFGTVKGAFTGAMDSPGLFEKAENGSIFLDEINSMPIALQAKLLRALQEKRYGALETPKPQDQLSHFKCCQ